MQQTPQQEQQQVMKGGDTRLRLTVSQFNGTIKVMQEKAGKHRGRTMTDEAIDMARSAMVDGLSQSEVAAQYGVTRQLVNRTTKKIFDFYQVEVVGFPKSWKTTIIHGPPELIKQVRKLEQDTHQEHLKHLKKRRVNKR